jgi:hypothetical protein
MVVHPGHAELDDAFRFHHAFEQALLGVARMFQHEGPHAFHDFVNGLGEFGLVRVAGLQVVHEGRQGRVQHGTLSSSSFGLVCA